MTKNITSKIVTLFVVLVLPGFIVFVAFWHARQLFTPPEIEVALKADHISSVDHSTFEILQQKFEKPQDLTAACLSCHTERDKEVMATAHWTWTREVTRPDGEKMKVGKLNLPNNFCTGACGNNGSCMRCHIGYDWKDKSFDFNNPNNIDCIVCHDKTKTYVKRKGGAGMPSTPETATPDAPVPDYNYIAANVGLPDKHNCGFCHFEGGGGNNVKHGDLEKALLNTTKSVDVHMAADGKNMNCIDCHKTERHNISGRQYSVSAENTNRVTCEQCHTTKPHGDKILDNHFKKVACQTCHIPEFAKVNATVMYWDWSQAGQTKEDGTFRTEYDTDHNYSYLSIKGRFVWDKNVVPEYVWFNGTASHLLYSDSVKEEPVKINTLYGDANCPESKIYPVKVHRGKQPFDAKNKTILAMKLHADKKGEGAFWQDLDWDKSIELGMEYTGLPYSGEYEFLSTEVSWPVNHMVSPKEQSLKCADCHTRNESRLAGLNDFYLPGRDNSSVADIGGFSLIILTILGVMIHMILRVIKTRKLKKYRPIAS
jgi:octaheme c-type cytochrome (tetrathionate reductase family)